MSRWLTWNHTTGTLNLGVAGIGMEVKIVGAALLVANDSGPEVELYSGGLLVNANVFLTGYEEIVPGAGPGTSPTNPTLWSTGDLIAGNAVFHTSDQGMQTQIAAAGSSDREFVLHSAMELLAVAGAGGTATAAMELIPESVHEVLITVLGVGNTGSDGFRETATATVRVDSGGTAAFVAAATLNSNPTVNALKDTASDTTFNSGGGSPSSIAVGVAGETVTVTVTNAGAGPNDFCVFFDVKGFAT